MAADLPEQHDKLADAVAPDQVEQRAARAGAAEHGLRLDKWLVSVAPEFSRNHLQGLIERGHVQLDGMPATQCAKRIKVGQALQLALVPTDEALAFKPEAVPLNRVFEDEHLLVLDKPAGLVVHPAPGNWSGTVLNGLLAAYPGAASLPRAGIVHRLDKDTSGLMVVGKSLPAVTALSRAIALREVGRRYVALVHGQMAEAPFSVEAPIGRDPASRVRMAVVATGRAARTDVEPLAHGGNVTAVRCTLHSGRTHQIRVHLAHSGHALVGDVLYGGRLQLGLQRQALHAAWLAFKHPILARPLAFASKPQADLAAAWEAVAGAWEHRFD